MPQLSRRAFSGIVASSASGLFLPRNAPAIVRQESAIPQMPYGVASGDVRGRNAVIWSKTDRPARMWIEWDTTEKFANGRVIRGPEATDITDFTAKFELGNLPIGQTICYRVRFEDLRDAKSLSSWQQGKLLTPTAQAKDVFFAWSGDTAGQGYGINPDLGGMPMYETIRKHQPQFFLHSGDTIYADGPLEAELKLDDGKIWKNLVTPAKSKVAETLAEFRGAFAYNLLDENVRKFNTDVPLLVQWDDHEVANNWYPGETLEDPRYKVERNASILASRARRAFFDYFPIRDSLATPQRIDRVVHYGPLLDVFVLDKRSYRGSNSANRQEKAGPETALLGPQHLSRLKRQLKASTATWKVIASDMPIGMIVGDGREHFEAAANGNGPALGRELEIADLLSFMKREKIFNTVWLTADVHHAAAHFYDPLQAQFSDFEPFWEFVAGPMHAGTFGPSQMDNTFGPQVKFNSVPKGMKGNRPPSEGLQFYGLVKIEAASRTLTVALHNLLGEKLYELGLEPKIS
jgi:alkaline phosphatase D